ncbi:class I SAM-dependent methyltransferase [Rhizobium grahamii]|uniref:Class I SAM-dependent methyltransferase n=1 Tax=Rhizobium grahamii TaxID=1120045 RepID=A0A5Q0C9L4_9HYPH|nr:MULTISPECIES: methyltransferase domain-containing protein [Rhizobium]QFY62015.1 class I SAM-dependent methyltransferase [Rhizobium grahamii]QRM48808.1 class I SAM-dependent methyltransferase [Rhizobium sp. BG6]
MKISDKLNDMYAGYYNSEAVLKKRVISARQTISHITEMTGGRHFRSVIDVGAGEGSVLAGLDAICFADDLNAVEISESGCEAIAARKLKSLRSVQKFDGYSIPAATNAYEIGIAAHVLEHVEFERPFLQEIGRVCDIVYVEVPLELTLSVERSIQMAAPYGHVNFYTPATLRNVLETSGLEVIDLKVWANSLEYEMHVSGRLKGRIVNRIRNTTLTLFPKHAPFLMTTIGGALCRKRIER